MNNKRCHNQLGFHHPVDNFAQKTLSRSQITVEMRVEAKSPRVTLHD